ncbi:MAG: hypothetical protein FJ102_16925, partial [Deltaproteobacteria bacterium]|nr:hypothetical protein [Deltaproteobacteria bacterium]
MVLSRPAVTAFIAYLLGALVLGEVFPFSRYTMYADIAARDYGAIPVFVVDGSERDPSTLHAFHDLDPAEFVAPAGVVTAMDYVTRGWADLVRRRPATAPGPLAVEVAYDLVRVQGGEVQR